MYNYNKPFKFGSYKQKTYKNYTQFNNWKPKKRSGAKFKRTEFGAVISGWKYDKNAGGIISLFATPYKGTKKTKSPKSGITWENWYVRLTMPDKRIIKTSGLINLDNHKLYIKDFNMIANPKANNGGYFGKHISKNYK